MKALDLEQFVFLPRLWIVHRRMSLYQQEQDK
jgi:hypothetical protein